MRYIFPLLLVLLVFFGGCEKGKEEYNDSKWQGEYTSSAYSSNTEETDHNETELLTDTEFGFGEIYIID